MFHRNLVCTWFALFGVFVAGCAEQNDTGGQNSAKQLRAGEASAADPTESPEAGVAEPEESVENEGPAATPGQARPEVVQPTQDSGGKQSQTATLYHHECTGFEELEEAQEPPSVCEWAEALDTIVLGEIAGVESNHERYSVGYAVLEALAPLIRENGLESEFPWLDAVLAVPTDERSTHVVVPSCPDGLRKEIGGEVFSVAALPAITMSLRRVETLFGKQISGSELQFFAPLGAGLLIDDQRQARRDGILEDGTLLGIGLTASPESSAVLVQGRQVPFTISDGVVVARQPCRPIPSLPAELDGMSIDELRTQLQACNQGASRSAVAQASREMQLASCFSGEPGMFCHAGLCSLGYDGELPE